MGCTAGLLGCSGGAGGTTGGSNATSSSSSGSSACNTTGTVVPDPTEAAVLADGTAPDFSCYSTPAALGPVQTVHVAGCVTIFGVGNRVKQGMKLAIYGTDQDPGPSRDSPNYGTVDLVVDAASGCESEGRYEASGLPTNTPLIFKTYDTDTGTNKTAVDTYQYNVILRSDRHKCSAISDRGDTPPASCSGNPDRYFFEANMVFVATYTSIPNVAGRTIEGQNNVSDGLGRAAVAGEVRDCRDGGRSVAKATVGGSCVDSPAAKVVYFDGREDPKPDTTRRSTHTDGLFSILNAKATRTVAGAEVSGLQHELEGKVLHNGQVHSAGKATVYTYPDSVTIFSPQGLLPSLDTPAGSATSSVSSSASSSSSSSTSASSSTSGGLSSTSAGVSAAATTGGSVASSTSAAASSASMSTAAAGTTTSTSASSGGGASSG
jgi:hypothetical protein